MASNEASILRVQHRGALLNRHQTQETRILALSQRVSVLPRAPATQLQFQRQVTQQRLASLQVVANLALQEA